MDVVVDLSTKEVSVRDSDDLHRFAVRVVRPATGGDGDGDLRALGSALRSHAIGTVGADGDALVAASVIRQLAHMEAADRGAPLDTTWDAEFTSMLEYAASRGWMEGSDTIRAHVEWGAAR